MDPWILDSRINKRLSIQSIEAVFTRSTVNLEFVTGFAANTLLPRTDISKSLETSRGGYMYARTPKGTCI